MLAMTVMLIIMIRMYDGDTDGDTYGVGDHGDGDYDRDDRGDHGDVQLLDDQNIYQIQIIPHSELKVRKLEIFSCAKFWQNF